MSYCLMNSMRLYCRDAVWFARYLARLRNGSSEMMVLCNSYPKSGTHLLAQVLEAIPGLRLWNDIVSVQSLSGVINTDSHIRWKLGSVPGGQIIRSHLMCTNEIKKILDERKYRSIFIYRDLRDVAVSHVKWVMREKRYFLNPVYARYFNNENACLMSTISGLPLGGRPIGPNLSSPPIGQDFERWKGWISDPDTLAVRYEDLVGSRGGGSDQARTANIRRILEFLGIRMSISDIASRFSHQVLPPQRMHTFRSGKTGEWKKSFGPDHIKTFKNVAGDLLVELGYEKDLDW